MIRALIVDDEAPARARLRQLLTQVSSNEASPAVEVVAEASNGPEAIALVDELKPNLIFLDVQMPEMSGIDVLSHIAHTPRVIFTTAYDQHAVEAFELGAVDYLRKPFGADRLAAALNRMRTASDAAESAPVISADVSPGTPLAERVRWAVSASTETGAPLARLFVRDRDRVVLVRTVDIERLDGEDDYVGVQLTQSAGGKRYLVHLTLAEFERRLDPRRFLRIHRSHMVNLDHVMAFVPYDGTRLQVELRTAGKLIASRTCSRALRHLMV